MMAGSVTLTMRSLGHLGHHIRRASSVGLGIGKTPTTQCGSLQRRRLATAGSTPCNWRVGDHYFEIRSEDAWLQFDYVWLRDSCRSAASFDPKTSQRIVDTASIDLNLRPADAKETDGHVFLTWPDGHVTSYSLGWLVDHSHGSQRQAAVQPRALWNRGVYEAARVQSARWETIMSCREELRRFLRDFLLYGVAFVEGVPATVEATQALSERVSIIRETLFGRVWSFTSDLSRGDSAYTNGALDRHTDTSYFHEPCGVQVFHCLKHEGTGGRTLLVDGFYSAQKVLKESPESFELLSRVPITHENVEHTGAHRNHMVGVGPVLSTHPWNNELYMIRYNNYDRSPIDTAPQDVIKRWYQAHRLLTDELRKPENELWVKLTPGKVVFIDNWRVMHGRDSFTGLRQICGCYLPRDDVHSTARTLGLLA
ncbi:hypothetical protein NHX12_010275 [Muraenolepis orangiensis]|uniref:Trimethyllysine dioxygenase, mitochondrial n=1 Tax=Muraenolepis orangiensis TaxID=630683 RepID=A0A9Q0DLX6_9TELE|nr:hypothetical protein NHX12_010275 [Muraenolepis orangiensis]